MYATHAIKHSTRISSSMLLAMIVTLLLLLAMQAMIAVKYSIPVEVTPIPLGVIMEERQPPVVVDKRPKPPELPKDEPIWTPNTAIDPVDNELVTDFGPPLTNDGPVIGTGNTDGSLVAMFPVAPIYPRGAQTKGIEGYVDLAFDVAASGKTENIRVINAQPKGYFERASRKALAKWKYKPTIENGVAVVTRDVTTRISFALE